MRILHENSWNYSLLGVGNYAEDRYKRKRSEPLQGIHNDFNGEF